MVESLEGIPGGQGGRKQKFSVYWMQLLRALLIELSRENEINIAIGIYRYICCIACCIDIDFNEHKC